MRHIVLIASLMPFAAFAAGDDDSTPSTPKCNEGYVYDTNLGACKRNTSHLIDDTERYAAVREYAYAGRTAEALQVLASMEDQGTDRVMTYRGFLARQSGDMASAMRHYLAALKTNPDNLLARSYMAQGLITLGDLDGAKAQHREIMARGGEGTWAEASLAQAIQTGKTYRY